MKFLAKTRYGLRAVVALSKNYVNDANAISASRLAQITGVSEPYLEKIMGTLKRNNIVTSSMGLNGGYILATNPKDLKVGTVLSVLEGELFTSDCITQNCKNAKCPNKSVFNLIYTKINQLLDNISLYDLITNNIEGEN